MTDRFMNKVDSILLKNMNEGLQEMKKEGFDISKVSDGYHTFGELYEHRIALFRTVCSLQLEIDCEQGAPDSAWKSKLHSDGTEFNGWFVAGINKDPGEQITYHIPISEWDKWPGKELDIAPKWDGHTSAEVLQRLKAF